MGRDGRYPAARVIGPDGSEVTLADLPPRDTQRWVVRRKAIVVTAVLGGLITLFDACARYNLSIEEFLGWQRAVQRDGMPGLRATRPREQREEAVRN
jgi:hypothetical protein